MTNDQPRPIDFDGWILAVIATAEMPQAYQMRLLYPMGHDDISCEACGREAVDNHSLKFYRSLNIADPDGMDPEIVYCQDDMMSVWKNTNNFTAVDKDFRTYLWKPRITR